MTIIAQCGVLEQKEEPLGSLEGQSCWSIQQLDEQYTACDRHVINMCPTCAHESATQTSIDAYFVNLQYPVNCSARPSPCVNTNNTIVIGNGLVHHINDSSLLRHLSSGLTPPMLGWEVTNDCHSFNAHAHAHKQAHTRMHARAHTYTHAHTHTPVAGQWLH